MEWIEVIKGAVGALIVWATWVTVAIFNMKSDIRSNGEHDANVEKLMIEMNGQLKELTDKINELEKSVIALKKAE